MKKFIAIFMSIITIFSFTTFAEENKMITFKNIPWGITAENFINQANVSIPEKGFGWWQGDLKIPEDGYYCSISSIYDIDCYLDCPYEIKWIDNDKYNHTPGFYLNDYNWYNSKENIKVAGYPVSSIYLYFMKPVNIDGTINHNKNEAIFYMGRYIISDCIDRVEVFDDLTEKLTSLYGPISYEQFDGQVARIWKDEFSNCVALIRHDTKYENLNDIEIVYMSGSAMNDMQILDNALYNETINENNQNRIDNADNTDGL